MDAAAHTVITQARVMVAMHGGVTKHMVAKLQAAGYSLGYIAELINIWRGKTQ